MKKEEQRRNSYKDGDKRLKQIPNIESQVKETNILGQTAECKESKSVPTGP